MLPVRRCADCGTTMVDYTVRVVPSGVRLPFCADDANRRDERGEFVQGSARRVPR
jgi:hypothetical protein